MSESDYITAFRFGFGAMPNKSFDPANELKTLPTPDPSIDQVLSVRILAERAQQKAYKDSGRAPEEKKKLQELFRDYELADLDAEIKNAASSDAMFTNRLAAFWANHFCLGKGKQILRSISGLYETSLRQKIFGNFSDLLITAELHPAMVSYLNLDESIGPHSKAGQRTGKGFNENLGREILELHTLGVDGGYAQADVIALSKILTGWHIPKDQGEVQFTPNRAEPGAKTLLGQSFGGDRPNPEDTYAAFESLAKHPATAKFIGTKLARHFFGPQSAAAAKAIADVFLSSKGNLVEVYHTMLALNDASAPLGAQNRTDFEFLVSALRASPLRAHAFDEQQKQDGAEKPNPITSGAMQNLTQQLWKAPSPKGWPDDPAFWISPTIITARLKLIPAIVRHYQDVDPLIFAEAALGPLMTPNTRSTIKLASNRLQSIGLVLASPDFNRR